MKTVQNGFTLIELMIVIAIIGILASVALPNYQSYVQRAEVVEALTYASALQHAITDYQREAQAFPADNNQAGLPAAELMISNRITRVDIVDGAIHIKLGNKVGGALQGKILSFRPAVVTGSPASQIAWLCGYSPAVTGMEARGENRTDIPAALLPLACR